MSNYSFTDPTDVIEDGATISSGNFSQLAPNTEILVGKTLTINGGNWTNVTVQPEWTVNGGNWTQVSRCSHLHPNLVDFGLVECATECEHMTSSEEITVDGEVVDTLYEYEDTVS